MPNTYQADLAYIHDSGFGHLATNAASVVIGALRGAKIHTGTVVDLGCGSGITSYLLHNAGYDVIGFDLSEPLLEIARSRVPTAAFYTGSFSTVDFPPSAAVTAIGEVFNYTFDTTNCTAVRIKTFEQIYDALLPGGLFLFDMATSNRAPSPNPQRTFVEDSDWSILVETEADITNSLLIRYITSFRKQGELYRRSFETHQLQLVEADEVIESLQKIGFSVQTFTCYDSLPLPPGLVVFLANKLTT